MYDLRYCNVSEVVLATESACAGNAANGSADIVSAATAAAFLRVRLLGGGVVHTTITGWVPHKKHQVGVL